MLHCSALNYVIVYDAAVYHRELSVRPEPVERRWQMFGIKRQIRSLKSRRQFGLEQQEAIWAAF